MNVIKLGGVSKETVLSLLISLLILIILAQNFSVNFSQKHPVPINDDAYFKMFCNSYAFNILVYLFFNANA